MTIRNQTRGIGLAAIVAMAFSAISIEPSRYPRALAYNRFSGRPSQSSECTKGSFKNAEARAIEAIAQRPRCGEFYVCGQGGTVDTRELLLATSRSRNAARQSREADAEDNEPTECIHELSQNQEKIRLA
jgi:hypothetical protein